jgi:two-component system response regulator HydG
MKSERYDFPPEIEEPAQPLLSIGYHPLTKELQVMPDAIRRILLVDDEVTFLKTLKRHLKRKGFALETAGNGRDASRLIRQRGEAGEPFDLVITDVIMPDMDGIELLGWIKSTFPEVSVILLSGFGDGDAISDEIRPGIDTFAVKPITPEKMMGLIRKLTKQRERP